MPVDGISLLYPAAYGVNSAEWPVIFHERQQGRFVQMAVNMRIDSNRWRTAHRVRELAPVPGEDFERWASLHTQAAIWYDPKSGQGPSYEGVAGSKIVESAGGRMFALDVSHDSFSVKDYTGDRAVGTTVPIAYLCQAENYVIRTEPESQTQIWDGKNNIFFSNGYSSTAKLRSAFPNFAGPTVYAGGRLWTVLFGRRIYVSDSLHQTDQVGAGDLLKFTDQTYDYINVYFAPPANEGDIVGLTVTISSGFNDSRAQGEVLAFCKNCSAWGIQLGIPRTQWPTSNMRHSRSTEAGASGMDAFSVRDGDILMRTVRGIESLNLLARERNTLGNPVIDLGADIQEILKRDDPESLKFCSMINPRWMNGMMFTVAPVVKGNRHYHLGWMTNDWNPTNERIPQGFAWTGLNTLPPSIGRVVRLISNDDIFRPKIYAIVDKDDGNSKGIVEITQEDGDDILANGENSPKRWMILTKKLSTGGVFTSGTLSNAWLSLQGMNTDVRVKISVRSSEKEWRTVRDVCAKVEVDANDPFKCHKNGERLISLGRITEEMTAATWYQFLLEGEGVASVDFGMRTDNPKSAVEQADKNVVVVPTNELCNFDPFKFAL